MGNLPFAIMHGLSKENGNIRSIIERSSADWLVRKGRAKSSPAVENAQTDFFESVPEPEAPRQIPVDPNEVEKIVSRALPTAHEVDSMKNLFVFVRRKGIEAWNKSERYNVADNQIADLSPLVRLTNLVYLTIIGNPVNKEPIDTQIRTLKARGVNVKYW